MSERINEVRSGSFIRKDKSSEIYEVLENNHNMRGRGGATYELVARQVYPSFGGVLRMRMNSGEKVDILFVDEVKCKYLYFAGENAVLMRDDDCEQVEVPRSFIAGKELLIEGNEDVLLSLVMCDDIPIYLKFPKTVSAIIERADPALKGQTATASYKGAETTGKLKIQVPQFIEAGEKILIDTETLSYVGRDK